MSQVQAYQGYFRDGKFISQQPVKLPENVEVFITITGRKAPLSVTEMNNLEEGGMTSAQLAAKKFLEATEKINQEGFDEETLESFRQWDAGEFRLNLEERSL